MPAATTSNSVELLKRLWGDGVQDPLYKRSKLLMKCKKDTKFGGEGRYIIVKTSGTTGGSADYATAEANENPVPHKRYFVNHKKEYQTFSIDGDLIARSMGNANAVMEALKSQLDGARYSFARAMAARAWGNEGGSLARISASATLASVNLLLREPRDHVKFEQGMKLKLSSDTGTGSSPAGVRAGALTVSSVERRTGTAILTGNITAGVAAATVNDYIFREGDYANAMSGMAGWHPTTAPTGGDSFFGVDRSTGDPVRNYGYIYDASTDTTYEQKIQRALAEGANNGIQVTDIYVNPRRYAEIALEFGSKRQVQVEQGKFRVGYSAIEVHGPDGTVQIISEPDCPYASFYGVDPEMIYLRTAGECPMELKEDTGKLLGRVNGSDSYRGRLGAYGNFFHEVPGNSVQANW